MKKMVTSLLVYMLIIFGWFHYVRDTSFTTQNGFTYKMVENVLGAPAKVEQKDKITKWVYVFNESKKILFFEDGKVVITYHRQL